MDPGCGLMIVAPFENASEWREAWSEAPPSEPPTTEMVPEVEEMFSFVQTFFGFAAAGAFEEGSADCCWGS